MPETYLIASDYLSDERIKAYFDKLGWQKYKKRDKKVTLIYLDYLNIYKGHFYKYSSFVKNQIGDSKHYLTEKDNLRVIFPFHYSPGRALLLNLKEDKITTVFKKLFVNNQPWIIKPIKGREGIGIKVIDNFEDFKHYLEVDYPKLDFRKIKDRHKIIVEKYIDDPLLFRERKFHLRFYFMIFKENVYLFPKAVIATALKKYKRSDYGNKDIHDSHYNDKSLRNLIYPEDSGMDQKQITKINKQMLDLLKYVKPASKGMKCYPEDEHCYEVMSADIMILKNYDIKLLEINHSTGAPETMDKKYPLFENQLDIVLGDLLKIPSSGKNYFVKV